MQSLKTSLFVSGLLLLLLAGGSDGLAQNPGGARQQYGDWKYNAEKGYHYREYQYKPKPTDTKYEHEYVVYYKNHPQRKSWLYYYNPKTEKFWARCPSAVNDKYKDQVKQGKELWSILPSDKRMKSLDEIDNKSFPEPSAKCPTIPGSSDNAPIKSPPADLP